MRYNGFRQRALLRAAVVLLLTVVLCGPGTAQPVSGGAEEHVAYVWLHEALGRYRQIAAEGGWPSVPSGPLMALLDHDRRVPALRARLVSSGDLAPERVIPDSLFDENLDRAARAFQERHGLDVDGVVGPQTLRALNVPAEERVRQIELNLGRMESAVANLGKRFALVNIPAYQLWVVDQERTVLTMKAILGTRTHKTPVFSTSIESVVLAPYWYIPQSIARNEILPKLRRDSTYLVRNRIRRLPNGALRQDPGPANPLGVVKFIIPNSFGVRMHDTSEPWLFGRTDRAFSHGCIRLERPLELAEYLLAGTEWTRRRMEDVIGDWKETSITVEEPLPVHVVYWTAWAEEDGTVHFRRDVYGYDQASGSSR